MATEVAELYASLSFKIDASMKRAEAALTNLGKKLDGLESKSKSSGGWFSGLGGKLAALGGAIGFGSLIKKGLEFNSTVEDTRNQIAGMMALATKTDLNDNLSKAGTLMDHLRERAAKLPGTTMEYAQMLGALTQPILDAKLGMQDLEDITVNAVVGAKALGVEWGAAARDVDQALRGSFHSTDVFTGKLLGSIGYKGETGRTKFNAMSAQGRASELKRALTQKQLTQLAEAQGQTASGKWSTLVDTMQQTLGRVMAPLFAKLVGYLEQLNKWLDANSAKVNEFASVVGGVLVTAFEALVTTFGWLIEHQDVLTALLIGIATLFGVIAVQAVIVAWPIYAIAAAVAAVAYVVIKLVKNWDTVKAKIGAVLEWLDEKLYALGGAIMAPFIAIKDFFVGVASTIYGVFKAVFDWIGAKLDWVKEKTGWLGRVAAKAAEFIPGLGPIAGMADTLSTLPGAAGGGPAGTASRAVPPSAGAPVVNVAPPNVEVTVSGDINSMFNTKVDKRVQFHNENMWRNAGAATGAGEP